MVSGGKKGLFLQVRLLNKSHSSFINEEQNEMLFPSVHSGLLFQNHSLQEKLLMAVQMCHGVSCAWSDSGNPPGSPIAQSGIICGIIPLN